MKVAMLTPAATTSAIGRMARLVVRAMRLQGHGVTVVRTEDLRYVTSPAHDFGSAVVAWNDPGVDAVMENADAVVYQVGNSFDFHAGVLNWLPRRPGVVCLHDYFLGHLFWGWAEGRRSEATRLLRAWYGDSIAAGYFAFRGSDAFIAGTHQSAPMVEWIAAMATGIVTHSSWGLPRVLEACAGPVAVAPLPYDVIGSDESPPRETGRSRTFTILTVGHINPNKHVESVIRSVGRSDLLRLHTRYCLAGRIEHGTAEALQTLASDFGVSLTVWGEVDDRALLRAFQEADVICCIRRPTLEAASASAIEAMLLGKPVIVSDAGFYRELPDDCVCKISPDDEVADLQQRLEHLYRDPEERLARGRRARAWATGTFAADNYAQVLLTTCADAARAAHVLGAARWYAETLAGWGGSPADMTDARLVEPLRLLENIAPI